MFHVAVLDAMTTCNCLSECLREIKQWSDAHPAHHILFLDLELKLTGDFLRVLLYTLVHRLHAVLTSHCSYSQTYPHLDANTRHACLHS